MVMDMRAMLLQRIYMKIVVVPMATIALLSAAHLFVASPWAYAQELPAGFSFETVARGLNQPTSIAFAPDGRIFVGEKGGMIKVVKEGRVLPRPFYVIRDINTHVDRGLVGIALDEDFAQNGYVYVSYTHEHDRAGPFGPKTGRIARVTARGDSADTSSLTVLVGTAGGSSSGPLCKDLPHGSDCIPSDAESHSVGDLAFRDGYLWASVGDGASFNGVDPLAMRSQDLDSLAGKIIRIDRNGRAPVDNPFFDGDPTGNRSKVYAYGFRNAYRFAFRPSTGTLFAGDVGWFSWEEVNVVTRGGNYGWPCYEGAFPQPDYDCTVADSDALRAPLHAYTSDRSIGPQGAIGVTGGDFMYAPAYPQAYDDIYLFGDFMQGILYAARVDARDATVSVSTFATDGPDTPVAIKRGPDDLLYVVSITGGDIKRLAYGEHSSPIPALAETEDMGHNATNSEERPERSFFGAIADAIASLFSSIKGLFTRTN